jgi:predicted O-linked N-acetylglucosamine transferase (SPINDLY family)
MTPKKILTNPEEIFKKAIELIENNQLESAINILKEAEKNFPNEFSFTNLLAQVSLENNNINDGINLLKKSLQINSNQPLVLFDLGIAFLKNNQLEEAIKFFDKSAILDPTNIKIFINKAVILNKLNRLDELINCYQRITQLNPNYIDAYTNQAETLYSIGKVDDALNLYYKAIEIEPKNSAIYNNFGNLFYKLDRLNEAINFYEKSITIKSDNPSAYKNLGLVFIKKRKSNEAINYLKKSIQNREDYEVYTNLAVIYSTLNNKEALIYYDKAIKLKPNEAEAYVLKAYHLQSINKIDKAILTFDDALKINKDYKYLFGERLHSKNSICDWANFENDISWVNKRLKEKKCVAVPLSVCAFFDDPEIQKLGAEIYVKDKYPFNNNLGKISKYSKNKKIKLGYFSGDFGEHPVAYLVTELFELHDKAKFELFAFSVSDKIKSKTRTRIEKSFDEFVDVANYSDKEVALLAREKKIDIAIDLGGYTKNSRSSILAMGAAPIQINYLGYPGTTGANYIDYIISDKFIIPNELQHFYSEKIIYLPKCYQPNEESIPISKKIYTRKNEGIPESVFVFCCFNNSWKITPKIFKIWIRLLSKIEKSILWFPGFSSLAIKNLKNECSKLGVDEKRLVFSSIEKVREDHHAKIKLADIFLDCFPYGAQSTASDFLRAGVPVITLRGKSFSNQVASSILINLNLSELVTLSEEDYENLAIKFATNPDYLKEIKEKLMLNVKASSLYNVKEYTRSIESGYIQVYDRYHDNLNPDNVEAK